MSKSNESKSKTLGMPFGTACGRLRKNILFHLLEKLKENVCFKCGERIIKVDDLSIEHKKPWEGRSAELFWDLENISFSHLHCNRPHRFVTENLGEWTKPIDAPVGMAWCGTHKKFLSVESFYKNRVRSNGLCSECKECHDRHQGHGLIRGRLSACNSNG